MQRGSAGRETGGFGAFPGRGGEQAGGHELARRGQPVPPHLRRASRGAYGHARPHGDGRASHLRGAGHAPGRLPRGPRQALPRAHRVRRGHHHRRRRGRQSYARATCPTRVLDPAFAASFAKGLAGSPQAAAACLLGHQGERAQGMRRRARQGTIIDLAPRDIVVHDARLARRCTRRGTADELPSWDVEFHVSKGTYIRALARDAGAALGCPAHVAALERTAAGPARAWRSASALETLGGAQATAPRSTRCTCWARASSTRDGPLAAEAWRNGNAACQGASELFERRRGASGRRSSAPARRACARAARRRATARWWPCSTENKLVALYAYDEGRARLSRRGACSRRGCLVAEIYEVGGAFRPWVLRGHVVRVRRVRRRAPRGIATCWHCARSTAAEDRRRQRGADVRHRSGRGVPSQRGSRSS